MLLIQRQSLAGSAIESRGWEKWTVKRRKAQECNSQEAAAACGDLSRREFIKVGWLGVVSAAASPKAAEKIARDGAPSEPGQKSCIMIMLVGGPSHLDTWDMKPEAPEQVRGPFRPIATKVPGIHICEHFPRMASLADKFALIRSVHHDEVPIHESGYQLLQTGRLFRAGISYPHFGSVLSLLAGLGPGVPGSVVLPRPIANTGVSVPHGQDAGFLGHRFDPLVLDDDPARDGFGPNSAWLRQPAAMGPQQDGQTGSGQSAGSELGRPIPLARFAAEHLARPVRQAFELEAEPQGLRERYGLNTFGQSCLLARRLVEAGVPVVTVNMFDTVFNRVTWDCHANGAALATTLDDYKDTLCPMFDSAFAALLDDLDARGLLAETLVVAAGEFGRTYKLNPRGGRDHWPGVWTVIMAGGGVQGGRAVGQSDKYGIEPKERPVGPAQITATIYRSLGVPHTTQMPGPDSKPIPVVEAVPIAELFS